MDWRFRRSRRRRAGLSVPRVKQGPAPFEPEYRGDACDAVSDRKGCRGSDLSRGHQDPSPAEVGGGKGLDGGG